MSKYTATIEVDGVLALFSRPDTGGTPTSYPIPTWSAAKGIFESVARLASGSAWIRPTSVAICSRKDDPRRGSIRYQRYTFNYGGPLRMKTGASQQVFATAVSDVCYRITGEIVGNRSRKRGGGINPSHHLEEMFKRRRDRGQCHRTPCLGLSEFTASYWGPPRPQVTEIDTAINLRIPSLLITPFSSEVDGHFQPQFHTGAEIVNGEFHYQPPR